MPTTRFPLGEIMLAEQDVRNEALAEWNCAGCVHFHEWAQQPLQEVVQGTCRRYPPAMLSMAGGDGFTPRQIDGPAVESTYRCGEYLAADISLRGVEL
jgi:hypothetical protein